MEVTNLHIKERDLREAEPPVNIFWKQNFDENTMGAISEHVRASIVELNHNFE